MHTHIPKRLRFAALALCTALGATAGTTYAQNNASRIVVGAQAGGATDIVARLIAPKLAQALGEPVIVENKSGASGNIGAEAVARAAPDGKTLLMVFNAHPTIAALYPKLPFDPIKDFASVALVSSSPYLVAAKPEIGVDNLKQAIERARQAKKPLFIGAPGRGTPQHLMMERLRKEEKVEVEVVQYKGTAPALLDVMGNQVDFTLVTSSAAAGFAKAGKLRLLAVTSPQRLPDFPNTPTATELGIKSIAGSGVWLALLAPRKTPPAIINKLNRIINEALREPELIEKFAGLGMTPGGGKPEDLDKQMLKEQRVGSALIKELNITPD